MYIYTIHDIVYMVALECSEHYPTTEEVWPVRVTQLVPGQSGGQQTIVIKYHLSHVHTRSCAKGDSDLVDSTIIANVA